MRTAVADRLHLAVLAAASLLCLGAGAAPAGPPSPEEQAVARATVDHIISHVGPIAEETRVRYVVVEGKYALSDWIFGYVAGETLFVHYRNGWHAVEGIGGTLVVNDLTDEAVPLGTARRLVGRMRDAQQASGGLPCAELSRTYGGAANCGG